MCLQFLQVLLQTICSDEFPATPQKGQYDLILEQMYPQMCPKTGGEGDLKRKQPEATLASRVALLGRLTSIVLWYATVLVPRDGRVAHSVNKLKTFNMNLELLPQ